MWKKICLSIFSFICLCTVYNTFESGILLANTTTYNAGGDVTGRVNIAPTGISGGNIGMQKGDKVYIGVTNPLDNKGLGFQLLYYSNKYPTYNLRMTGSDTKIAVDPIIDGEESAWYTMSTKPITNPHIEYITPITEYERFGTAPPVMYDFYKNVANLNSNIQYIKSLDTSKVPNSLFKSYDFGFLVNALKQPCVMANTDGEPCRGSSIDNYDSQRMEMMRVMEMIDGNDIFFPDMRTMHSETKTGNIPFFTGGFKLSAADSSFSSSYFSYVFGMIRLIDPNKESSGILTSTGKFEEITSNTQSTTRPASMLNLIDVVFALQPGNASGYAQPQEKKLSSNYASIYEETLSFNDMKLRIRNASLTATLSKIQPSVDNTKEVTKVGKDGTLLLNANANAGSSVDGVNTVSVLIFQHNDVTGNDDFKYYKPMEAAKGNGLYEFDTTGIPLGKYKIAIVNEVYNEASTAPADSSLISEVKDLEIVSPISNLSFTPSSNLKYNVNVNVTDTIGTISSSNGAGTPTYTLIADSSHANDVTKFEIGNDGKSVQIKGSALDAGTYYFKIQAQDANGHPASPLEISATVTVAKGDVTSIAFDNPNQTKKSISDAQTLWNETATSTPSSGIKITYSIDSGNLNLLDVDANTGAITMKTTTGFGKVTIKATADDDPTSGKDNVNPKAITKDIIIYQNVDGSFTPDSASSDPNDPTFSASDPNVKGNGVLGSIIGTQGTPDNLTSGTITYSYTLKNESDYNYFVLSGSTLKVKNGVDLGVGSYTVKITVADKYGSKDVSVNINVGVAAAEKLDFYDDSNAIITTKGLSTPYGSKNMKVLAKGEDATNTNPTTYSIEDGSTNIITVHPSSGVLSIHGVGTTKVKATKAGMSGQAEASQTMNVTITKGDQLDFKFVDYAGSNVQLPIKGDGSYEEYKDPSTNKLVPYTKNGSFQLHTNGANGTVTYALKAGSESDVITVDADGTIHIINATMRTKMNRVSVIATSIDDSGIYEDKIIEIVVNIDQGEQTLSFVDQPIMIPHGNNVSVMPRFNSQNISNDDGSVLDTDIYLDQSTITYTNGTANVQVDSNDGVSLKSNYTGLTGVDGTIEAIKDGNRNYKQVKVIGTFHIMDPSENDFTISYPNEVIYGDTFAFTPRGDSTSTNVVYQITANTPAIADYNTTSKKASAKKVGEASFTIKRTADGEVEKEKTVKVQVKPKELSIKVDDKERYVGESNPVFTYEDFSSQLITWNMVQDIIETSDIKLTSTALQTSPKGSYPIIANTNDLNKKYSNYKFNFQNANLLIKQDAIDQNFYSLQLDDGAQTPYDGSWTNQNVLFISQHSDYTSVSNDKIVWNDCQITLANEGSILYDFWMKKDSGALSTSVQETIQIDKKAPVLKKIEATSSNNALEDILHKMSFGYFFKPGTMFTVYTDDTNGDIEVSKTKSIDYTIQKLQADGSYIDIKDVKGTQTASVDNETARIKISDASGVYQVCVTPRDHAGNLGDKQCRDVKLAYPGVNESSDNNELPDLNIDINDDGIPDLNITKNPGDKKPWVNIDTNGDGKPDMNLDREGDRIPYLKTGVIMEWKPDIKGDGNGDGKPDYRTSSTVIGINNLDTDDDKIPDLNIDFDLNGLPELNINTDGKLDKPTIEIDGNGDGKADINIDETKDGKPDKNIVEIKEWKPEHTVMEDGKAKYDTMLIENPEGKKELEDNNIIIEQPNGTFLPNYALKVDVITSSIDDGVKDKIIEKANGQVIKEVYSVELLKDGVQVQPDGRLKIKIPLPKNIISPHLIIELADGSYRKINAEVVGEYLVYESDFLGKVIVVGNGDVVSLPDEDQTPNSGGGIQPTVKGEYTSISGANTGDTSFTMLYTIGIVGSLIVIIRMHNKFIKEND